MLGGLTGRPAARPTSILFASLLGLAAAAPPFISISEAGGGDRPDVPAQGGVRQLLEKFGLIGTWSTDCNKRTSTGVGYTEYRVVDGLGVERVLVTGNDQRSGAIESATEDAPNELGMTWVWDSHEVEILGVKGKRWRSMDLTRNGQKVVTKGVFTANTNEAGRQTPWANQCRAMPASGESVPGSARQILERYGILGIWSVDCRRPASPTNAYVVFRALDEKLVQYDIMTGPKTRDWALVVESAQGLGPDEVILTVTASNRDVFKMLVDGTRARSLEFARNGTPYVAKGKYLPGYSNPASVGKETPWGYKCE